MASALEFAYETIDELKQLPRVTVNEAGYFTEDPKGDFVFADDVKQLRKDIKGCIKENYVDDRGEEIAEDIRTILKDTPRVDVNEDGDYVDSKKGPFILRADIKDLIEDLKMWIKDEESDKKAKKK